MVHGHIRRELQLKKVFENRVVLGVFCFFLGAFAMWGTQRTLQSLGRSILGAKFGNARDSFGSFAPPADVDELQNEMDGRTKEMLEELKRRQGIVENDQDMPEDESNIDRDENGGGLFSFGKRIFNMGSLGELKSREDNQNIYFDLPLDGIDENTLDVKVSGGQINISGENVQESKGSHSTMSFRSSFHRSFPIPPNADIKKVQIKKEENKIVIRFPKLAV